MARARNEKTAGPLLDKPRILLPEPGFFQSFCFYCTLLLLGGTGALGCFFTAFQIPLQTGPVVISGILCCLACVFLFLWKRHGWLFSVSCAVLWLLGVWLFFGDLVQGCVRTVNRVTAAYAEKLSFPLPQLAAEPLSAGDEAAVCTVFAVLLMLPFFWLLSWMLIQRKSALGAFCFTGIFLLAPLVFSILPSYPLVGVLLLFWLALLMTASSLGQRHKLVEERGRFHASGMGAAKPSTLLLLAAAVVCMVVVYAVFPESTYERPQVINDIRSGFTDGFGLSALLRGGSGSGNNRVDLNALGDRKYTGATVLRVKYDWGEEYDAYGSMRTENRQKDYLKSFVGSVYTGHSWERLSPEDSQRLSELTEGLHPQELFGLFRENLPTQLLDSSLSYRLSVENVSGNPRCIYAPYGLSALETAPEGMEYVDDGFLKSSHFFSGTKEYGLDALGYSSTEAFYFQRQYAYFSEYTYQEYLREYYNFATNPDADGYLSVLRTDGSTEPYLEQFLETAPTEPNAADFDRWAAPDWVLEPLEPGARDFSRALEAYNQFVYEKYTQLPDGLREELLAFLDGYGIDAGNRLQGRDSFTQRLNDIFQQNYTYSLSPPVLPADQDSVLYFLRESKAGYCVHFATAAAALYRAMGYPARYAEGYAVPSGNEGWQDVPDENAHAWVEVYQGGVGWTPVEVTPAVPGAPAAYYNAAEPRLPLVGPQPSAAPGQDEPSLPETSLPEASGQEPGASSGSPSPVPSGTEDMPGGPGTETPAWAVWLAVPAALLLAALLLLANRSLRLRRRKRAFSQRDRSRAALAVYAHLLDLYAQAVCLPKAERKPSQELTELAEKARFSRHMLTQEELQPFLREAERLERQMETALPLSARLRCKYLLALF